MPNPAPKSIGYRQRGIIPDPHLPCTKPEDEIEWLWTPLEQQLDAVATTFLNRLSTELKGYFLAKKARNVDEIREIADQWLKEKEKNREETACEASRLIVSPVHYPDIWETQFSNNVCTLKRTAPMGAGTNKITIEPRAVFRVLREEEMKDSSRVSIQLWMSFDTNRFDANSAKPQDFYGYKWRVNHDLWLERRSWRLRAASIISSVVPTVSSSFWSTQSSQATGPGHETHTEAVMRPDASFDTSLAGSTAPTETQHASSDGLLPGKSDSSRQDVLDVVADSKC
jgi:hypothetical protein